MSSLDDLLATPRRMTLTSWIGELPRAGEYMRSSGGSIYRITDVRPTRAGAKSLARLLVHKLARGTSLPVEDVVHSFAWNKRAPKRRCHERRR